jgi:hypothetical protein
VHRFLLSGVDSEFASNGNESDHLFAGSTRNYLDSGVALGLLFKPVFKDINSTVAGSASKRSSFFDYWFGGVFMLLKLIVLSSASLTLWLVPLVGLDKRIGWHKSMQGLSLCAAIACAVTAGNIARKQAEQNEIEEIKTRAITADVVDEIATSAYISQQQRQQEAEQILATDERIDEQEAELNSIKESLELLLSQTSSDSGELVVVNLSTRQREQIELILQCYAKGINGKNKILKEVWGVSAGSSQAYRNAKAEYEYLMPFINKEEEGE